MNSNSLILVIRCIRGFFDAHRYKCKLIDVMDTANILSSRVRIAKTIKKEIRRNGNISIGKIIIHVRVCACVYIDMCVRVCVSTCILHVCA